MPVPAASRARWKPLLLGLSALLLGVLAIAGLTVVRLMIPVSADEKFEVVVPVENIDRAVRVEAFFPTSAPDTQHPAILFLHGVEGPERYRAVHTRSCRELADRGYAVFYVHYFDAVDYADLWHLRGDGELDKEIIDRHCWQDAHRWCQAVVGVTNTIGRRPDVDARRIALDGISLGGFIALEVADEASRRSDVIDVCAVVANWCGQFELTDCESGFPPTLHIHGERDAVVPLSAARRSVEEIRAAGSEAELFVVPGAAHVASSAESADRTLSFLSRHLQPTEVKHASPLPGAVRLRTR